MSIFLEYLGYSVEIPHGVTLVGRDLACNLRFNDANVSRRHLRFTRRGEQVLIEDLGSMNGTRVNGELIEKQTALKDQDVIEVGGRSLLYRVSDDANAQSTRRLAALEDLSTLVERGPQRQMRATLDGTDRRRQPRRVIELRLVYTSSELEIEASTRDLSYSGVFVCTQVLDPLDTKCTLTMLIDGGPPLRVNGIVRRVVEHATGESPHGLGIEFLDVGEYEKSWLELAMSRLGATEAIVKVDDVGG